MGRITPEWQKIFSLLLDPAVSEIEANGPTQFFMKKNGKRSRIQDVPKLTLDEYFTGIEESLLPHIRTFNEWSRDSYLFEGPLEMRVNGERIKGRCHIVLAPAADSPQITIAKKSTTLATLDSIAERGSMSFEMKNFIEACVKSRQTMVLSGSTGSGKDLHKDTLIPTVKGFKKLSEINVGDKIFDENGDVTAVTKKYYPNDPKHYEITFKNGTKVKAGMGHLWKVTLLNETLKYGIYNEPLFDGSAVAKIKSEINKVDTWITIPEIMEIVNWSKSKGVLRQIVKGFGMRADSVFPQAKYPINGFPKVTRPHTLLFNNREILTHLLKINSERSESKRVKEISKYKTPRPTRLMTTEELFDYGTKNRGRLNFAIEAMSKEVDYTGNKLSVNPYALGAWLGDGNTGDARIGGADTEIRDMVAKSYPLMNESNHTKEGRTTNVYSWSFTGFNKVLRSVGVIGEKFIPNEYKIASKVDRALLIAGLVDTDGSVDTAGRVNFGSTNYGIVHGSFEIVKSLGWPATSIREKENFYKNDNGIRIKCKNSYDFSFVVDNANDLPIQVLRKKDRLEARNKQTLKQQDRHSRHYITDIKLIEDNSEDYLCLGVDSPTHMFLCTKDFIPTHNTTMLESISKLIEKDTRIGVAEDTPELELTQENVTYLHSVPWQPGMDPNNVATLDWCVAQFNRMRTDMLIVGETRGKEFASFLTAANSGMEGCLTTLHANNPTQCLDKMTLFAIRGIEGVSVRTINSEIGNAVNIIIQLAILPNGKHKVTQIQEVTPVVGKGDEGKLTTNALYVYDSTRDMFLHNAAPTDGLRKVFESRGVNILDVMSSDIGTYQKPHAAASEANYHANPLTPSSNPGRGLPIPQRREI